MLRRHELHAADPPAAQRIFAEAYSPGWPLTAVSPVGFAVTHLRCAAGPITVDEVVIRGQALCEIQAPNQIVVIQPRAGSVLVAGTAPGTPDDPVLVARNLGCTLQLNDARFDVVSIVASVLRAVAVDRQFPLPRQIQFLDRRPRSRAAVRAWRRALDYVITTFASPDTADQPIVVNATAALMASAVLECYPSDLTVERDVLHDSSVPAALKDAVAYIHCHASGDVGLTDLASAVHLTPRAVQYMFRHQLDTTPTEYVRRVRLHRAHQDLMAGSRSSTKVSEIALRWGFAHTGRFAVLYRQVYGRSPHTTLGQ